MRMYDPRVGRFFSSDPLKFKYPHYTPYQFAGNKPIRFIDLDGCEEADPSIDNTSNPNGTPGGPQPGEFCSDDVTDPNSSVQMYDPNRGWISPSSPVLGEITVSGPRMPSNEQMTEAYVIGLTNAIFSDCNMLEFAPFYAQRKYPSDLYTDPWLQYMFLSGQLAGDLLVMGISYAEIDFGAAEAIATSETVVLAVPGLLVMAHGSVALANATRYSVITATQLSALNAQLFDQFNNHPENGDGSDNLNDGVNTPDGNGPTRDWKQDKKLSNGEIEQLKANDYDIHELKGGKNASKYDLYKDKDGNIYVKRKGGQEEGEPLFINLNELE